MLAGKVCVRLNRAGTLDCKNVNILFLLSQIGAEDNICSLEWKYTQKLKGQGKHSWLFLFLPLQQIFI